MQHLAISILHDLQTHWPQPLRLQRVEALHGGSISQSMALHCQGISFFAKVQSSRHAAMFAAECVGLQTMRQAGCRVPRPICQGGDERHAWLILEFIPLSSRGDAALAGRQLASMHRHGADYFGFPDDNFIGLTPQQNTPCHSWPTFFREYRLLPQYRWLQEKGLVDRHMQADFERLLDQLDDLLGGHQPRPSLLHGDLWSGNHAYDNHGQPVMFDPACYYGDREADLAMTRLFGGFPAAFYEAYEQAWPLPEGAAMRATLYNLYHIFNHANLFGRSYMMQAASMLRELLH